MKTKLSLSLLLSFYFYLLPSQVPQGFNYQAIARGSDGHEIINTSLPVKISILSDTTGFYSSGTGTYLWEEQQSVTTNGFGLFTLTVGNPSATKIQGSAATFSAISWKATPLFIGTKIYYQSSWKFLGTSKLGSVPYSMISEGLAGPVKNLSVKGETSLMDSALFEVKNNTGQTVFAVYNEGVRIYVDDGAAKGSPKGGFAIGGFGTLKAPSQEFFRVTRDSTRVYVNNSPLKSPKGGFAIGGFDVVKGSVAPFTSLTRENYFIGHNSGTMNNIGLYNSFLGFETGFSSDASYNSFIGYQAGKYNTTGEKNTYLGYQAGYSGLTASGSNNIFLGVESGYSNTSGNDNIAIGNKAGRSNLDGTYNVMIGSNAGNMNVSGNFNTFVGYRAGEQTTSDWNTMIGYFAGRSNTTGGSQVMMGYQAGKNNTGAYNTFIGTGAGNNSSTGSFNTYVGLAAGNSATGTKNLFLGNWAGWHEAGSNTLVIETNYQGTDNYDSALVYGNFLTRNVRLNADVDIRKTLRFPNSGVVISVGATEALEFDGTSYRWGSGGTYNYFVKPITIGNASDPGSYELYVAGNAIVTGTFTNPSDERYKKNISQLSSVLPSIQKMRGVNYEWDLEDFPEMKFDSSKQIGFIAQEVEPFFPELVKTDKKGYKSMDYARMTVVLLQAVKEEMNLINEQKTKIESTMEENKELRSQIQILKEKIEHIEDNIAKYSNK